MYRITFLLLFAALAFTACEKVAFQSETEINNLNVFDEFAQLFQEKYAMFEQKNVDWEMLTDSVRATIDGQTSQRELADKMGGLVKRLRDGHTSLTTGDAYYSHELLDGYPLNFDTTRFVPIPDLTDLSGGGYKTIGDYGYIVIADFTAWAEAESEQALEALQDTEGLIIDVRVNGGGDPEVAADLAGRFTETAYFAGIEAFKTGPGPDDFSPSRITLRPTEGVSYTDKRVALLQARLSYSATTTLIYLSDPNPNVATFGSRSGGGTGSVASGYLINGWEWNMSVSDYEDTQGRKFDDGIEADFPVLDDLDTDEDEVIGAALDWLRG